MIAVVLLLSACAPVAQPAPPEPATAASSSVPATPGDAPAPTPTPEATPVAPTGTQQSAPMVRIAETPFVIAPTVSLTRSAVAADDEEAARFALHWYLQGLDRYREHGDFIGVRAVGHPCAG